MLVIRFNRTGRRNTPLFRLVVQEKSVAPGGRHIEVVGSWNPHKKEGEFNKDRILHWIEKGAQASDSVHNLLISQSIVEGKKRAIKMERPATKEEVSEEGQKEEDSKDSQEESKEPLEKDQGESKEEVEESKEVSEGQEKK